MLGVDISEKSKKQVANIFIGGLKSLVSIPPFNIALGMWAGFQSDRQADFLNGMSERIALVEEEKIDVEYLISEECYDLFAKAFKIHRQNRSKSKAKLILNLLTESIRNDRDPRFDTCIKEAFLDLLDDMSDEEQILLNDFEKGKYSQMSRGGFQKENDVSKSIALDLLYKKIILKDDDTWHKNIEITVLGKQFMEYIKILGSS